VSQSKQTERELRIKHSTRFELRKNQVALAVLTCASLTIGCGGGALSDQPGGTAGATFTRLTLRSRGGNLAPPPGAVCDWLLEPTIHTVVASSREWFIHDCTRSSLGSAVLLDDHRVLSTAEFASVEDALQKVASSQYLLGCGADMPVITLDIERTPGVVALLADDAYAGCPWEEHAGRSFVTGLGNLLDVFANLPK